MRWKWLVLRLRMLKRKLQDLTVCCTYRVDFLHQKAHSTKEFRRQFGVLDEIGRGGFGIVYKAIRLCDNTPVAVKFVEHKHVREWTMTCNQLIPSELCYLETCKDVAGVIHLVDWFASSKGFLIVMERPSSCMDIFDLISIYGKLNETTARGIFIQIVDTVCEMYTKHGLIHRDIKDENIIIDMDTGEVKLVDFGATAPAEKAMKKEFQGTRSYCPPEWFRQLQYLPLEATSWSLGVLLYILVTGTLPFRNEIQICLGRVKFPPYLTKECCQLIKSCLATAASTRASLKDIRQHSWLNHELPVHEKTFQQVLEANYRGSGTSHRFDELQAEEEYKQVNDVILTRESESVPNEKELEREESISSCLTMNTARESQEPAGFMKRLNSRYDNISASSLADYMSVTSLVTNYTDKYMDTVSVATTAMYYSANDLNEDEEIENCGLNEASMPVKSASAYNLAARARKKSLIFKSFDRELGTVPEQGPSDHLPLVMTVSSSSSTSADEPTICEDTPSDSSNAAFKAATPTFSSTRPSRHRPLQLGAAPTLAIFEAHSTRVK